MGKLLGELDLVSSQVEKYTGKKFGILRISYELIFEHPAVLTLTSESVTARIRLIFLIPGMVLDQYKGRTILKKQNTG